MSNRDNNYEDDDDDDNSTRPSSPNPSVAEQAQRMEGIFRPLRMSPMALTTVRKTSASMSMVGVSARDKGMPKRRPMEKLPQNTEVRKAAWSCGGKGEDTVDFHTPSSFFTSWSHGVTHTIE